MEALRLTRAYRGYRPGDVIHATPRLSEYLRQEGIAVPEAQTSFLPAAGAERAVEARADVETR